MNQYDVDFYAACPNNGMRIKYHLEIRYIHGWIPVEALVSQVQAIGSGYHEDIADKLREAFGGLQVLKAGHHGVIITTHRSGAARTFRMREGGCA